MKLQWSNDKHEYQWRQTLLNEEYCGALHPVPVSEINTEQVLSVLKPIWTDKHVTAKRLRARIEAVIDFATANGWRQGENPARWKGHLKNILPGMPKGEKQHYPSMPYQEMPAFLVRLQQREAMAALALEFTILTACRTSEVLLAKWNEFDLENAVWTIPAGRMKLRRTHRVPLSSRCLEILRGLQEARVSDFVFPGQKPDRPLSNMAMNMLLRRMGIDQGQATTHGFRSTLRDWAGDVTQFSREVAEATLAHKIGNEVEQAYRRSDALEKRRRLMQAWADYCLTSDAGKVVQLVG